MSVTILATLVLVITTVVNGTDCECQYNSYRNQFYGTQECFNSHYKLKENMLGSRDYNDTTISQLIKTFCDDSNCGSLLYHLLAYEKDVAFYDRQKVSQICVYS